jgi:hypothetical protein
VKLGEQEVRYWNQNLCLCSAYFPCSNDMQDYAGLISNNLQICNWICIKFCMKILLQRPVLSIEKHIKQNT